MRASRIRRVVAMALIAVVLIGAVVLLVGKIVSYGRLTESLREADWRWLALSGIGLALAFLGYVLGYRDIARVDGGPRLGYRASARVVATSLGAFAVSSAGGPAVEFWSLHRAGATRNEAVTRVLALNTLKFGVLGAAAAIAAAAILAGAGAGAPLAFTLPWLAVVPVAVGLALWLSSGRRGRREPQARPECGLRGFEHCLAYLAREGLRDAIRGVVYVRHLLARPRRTRPASPPSRSIGPGTCSLCTRPCGHSASRRASRPSPWRTRRGTSPRSFPLLPAGAAASRQR